MNKFKTLISFVLASALFISQANAQDYQDNYAYPVESDALAYQESGDASALSWGLPLGAVAIAAILIATTDRHHHHHHGSSSYGSSYCYCHCHY